LQLLLVKDLAYDQLVLQLASYVRILIIVISIPEDRRSYAKN